MKNVSLHEKYEFFNRTYIFHTEITQKLLRIVFLAMENLYVKKIRIENDNSDVKIDKNQRSLHNLIWHYIQFSSF